MAKANKRLIDNSVWPHVGLLPQHTETETVPQTALFENVKFHNHKIKLYFPLGLCARKAEIMYV